MSSKIPGAPVYGVNTLLKGVSFLLEFIDKRVTVDKKADELRVYRVMLKRNLLNQRFHKERLKSSFCKFVGRNHN